MSEGSEIPRGSDWFLAEFDRREIILSCRVLAQDLYQKDGVLSHERVAGELGRFLAARHADNEVWLSVIEFETRIATYLSCGERAITHALAVLLRLAMPFSSDSDYRQEWAPVEVGKSPHVAPS
jgi:hypothetical protein